jgi:hypothetical protein
MKLAFTLIFLCLTGICKSQNSANEQWRYVTLQTSLFNLVPKVHWMKNDSIDFTNEELFTLQIERGGILPDSTANDVEVLLTEVSDSLINGFLINGSKDTIQLILISFCYVNFLTEVKVNNLWLPFQAYRPFSCGMGIGKGRLFPGYKCNLNLENSTSGKIKLPFRMKMKIGKREIISNVVEVSCSQQQFKMIPQKIKDYTW